MQDNQIPILLREQGGEPKDTEVSAIFYEFSQDEVITRQASIGLL